MSARRVVVKLGTSIVADDRGELRAQALGAVCDAVCDAHAAGQEIVIVTSGAIARGMRALGLPQRPTAIEQLQAASAVGQGGLYRAYEELLAARGVTAAQVLLTFFDMSARSHYLNARSTLSALLGWRVVPVINENDTTTTDEISFGDNDFLAAQVAVLLDADLLVLLTDTEGLYEADPRTTPDAALVAEVRDLDALSDVQIGERPSTLGSGGMRSKVVAADMATAAGIDTVICGGLRPGALARALAGEREGTRFHARDTGMSSFKRWLKYAKPARGAIVVDAGAARALRDDGTSLLPVGVVEVRGEFAAGDAVTIEQDGTVLGKGLASLSAADLRAVKGLRSEQARERVAGVREEAVHRDYLVLD